MPGIGETLREARMRQRLDIADVEQRTKIRAKYLRALENEEFGMLPGPTFVKTFLRTYSEALGLDPHVLVEEYRANYEGDDELELQPLGPPGALGRDRGRRGRPVGPGILALFVLVAVVGALVVIGLLSDDNTGGGSDQAARTETTTERTTTQPKKKEKPPPPTRVKLRVVPSTPTWVCVDHGVGTTVVFENTIDSAQTFHGKRVRVNLGKRDVRLVKNGKQVQVTPGSDAVGFAFTPRRTRELPLGERPCA
ncbi:MAG TPA: helix-turn-helix domain-containing protein [Thermoleophilaceae bacterium]|jgi:cytoskeleton protein RodZ|nr:helix-turn-helix domain-containing protein [Thermoleophilaceae bacterium]